MKSTVVEEMAKLSKIERDLLDRLMKQKESALNKKTVSLILLVTQLNAFCA